MLPLQQYRPYKIYTTININSIKYKIKEKLNKKTYIHTYKHTHIHIYHFFSRITSNAPITSCSIPLKTRLGVMQRHE